MLSAKEKPWVLVQLPDETNSQIIPRLRQLSYAVCFRYHAHILCTIHSIPFVSLADTPKVVAFLADNDLPNMAVTEASFSKVCSTMVENQNIIKDKLKKVYEACHLQTTTTFQSDSLYTAKYPLDFFYINDATMQLLFKYVTDKVVVDVDVDGTPEYICKQILFHLLRTMNCEYTYGLTEKIKRLMSLSSSSSIVRSLKDDIY